MVIIIIFCRYFQLRQMGTLSGEATLVIFIVAAHVGLGHLIKERICSHWSKFFSLGVDYFEKTLSAR